MSSGPAPVAPPTRQRRDERALFLRYHRDGDFAARETLVEGLMPLVHHVARRYAGRGEPYDDLVQAGAIGLLKAVDRYDVDAGVAFTTYAVPNIAGEVKRHFRDRGWAVRPPRELQERQALITNVVDRLTTRLQRVPSAAEIAKESKLEPHEVLEGLQGARGYSARSLDEPDDDGLTALDQLGCTENGYEQVDRRMSLQVTMSGLDKRERRIVALRFYGGLTQSEIAERVGLSQMHVSRLLRHAVEHMGARLNQGARDAFAADAIA